MNRVLKTFLLWLMIAALPIQGMAAVIKATCGPRHHDMSSVMANVAEHHHDGNSAPHSHEVNNVEAEIEQFELATELSSSEKAPKTSYCSACAACCVAAVAPPSAVLMSAPFNKIEAAAFPSVVSFTGFIPASLERPPKHFSA